VNNAGVSVFGDGSVLGGNMDDWNWVMGVNFYGVLYGVRTFIPRMIEQDTECHVVNVSSSAGVTTAGGSYGVSKHAVVALSEALYWELKESKVNVSAYCPDLVRTEIITIERSRPERFKNEPPSKSMSEEWQAWASDKIKTGFSIDESANFLFDGIRENKLYVGLNAFLPVKEDYLKLVMNRAENIINERNPE
jgi:NAD(P)-dependent dehydrogenase (short-subunit alcohol dehydrogenase family)